MKTPLLKLTLLAVTVALFAGAASADQILVLSPSNNCGAAGQPSCATFTFTTTVHQNAPGSFNLSFQVQNATGGTTAYLQGFGLTLFNGSADGTFVNSNPALNPLSWNIGVWDNSKTDNGNSSCSAVNSHPGSLCIQVDSVPAGKGYMIAGGQGITFNFTVTTAASTSLLSSWHVMTAGTECESGDNCGNVFALSNKGAPTTTATQVPEPGSLALLGTGLLGAGGLLRRKLHK